MRNRWAFVAWVWLFFGVRLLLLEALPPFIDEAFHLHIAEQMPTTSPFHQVAEGRLFTNWYWLIFGSYENGNFWVIRYADLLILTLGFVALLASLRHLTHPVPAYLGAFLLIWSPYHLFFSAVALSDALSATGVCVAWWLAMRGIQHGTRFTAIGCGLALFVAFGFKITALPFFILPLGITAFMPSPLSRQQRWAWGASAILTLTVSVGGFFGVLIGGVLGYDALALARSTSSSSLLDWIPQALSRLQTVAEWFIAYNGWGIVAISAVGVVWGMRHERVRVAWVVMGIPCLAVLMGGKLFTRYLYLHYALVLILGGGALSVLWARHRLGRLLVGCVLAWVGVNGALWAWQFMRDPLYARLPSVDQREYMMSDASGYGLAEVANTVLQTDAQAVIGLLSNCQSLRYLLITQREVLCPRVNPNGEDIPRHLALIEATVQQGTTLVILENSPYVPTTLDGEFISLTVRPSGLSALRLFRMEQATP